MRYHNGLTLEGRDLLFLVDNVRSTSHEVKKCVSAQRLAHVLRFDECKVTTISPVTAKKQGKLYDSFEENSSCACKVLIIR
jgi:hypothetical protein